MTKKLMPVATDAEHLRLKGEMIERVTAQIKGQNLTGSALTREELVMIEMAVGGTLGDLGITLPFESSSAVTPQSVDTVLGGVALFLMPFDKVSDQFLDKLILDKSHSETSIVSFPEQDGLIITKPVARLILSLRMALVESKNG